MQVSKVLKLKARKETGNMGGGEYQILRREIKCSRPSSILLSSPQLLKWLVESAYMVWLVVKGSKECTGYDSETEPRKDRIILYTDTLMRSHAVPRSYLLSCFLTYTAHTCTQLHQAYSFMINTWRGRLEEITSVPFVLTSVLPKWSHAASHWVEIHLSISFAALLFTLVLALVLVLSFQFHLSPLFSSMLPSLLFTSSSALSLLLCLSPCPSHHLFLSRLRSKQWW